MTEAPTMDMAAILANPDVQKVIQAAAAQAAAEAVAQMSLAVPSPAAAPSHGFDINESTKQMFSEMALAIADMANQGSGRVKPISPKVMQQRAEAMKRMDALIQEVHVRVKDARDNGDRDQEEVWTPTYRVVSKIFFNERLIEPFRRLNDKTVEANEIQWTGEPNDALRPTNKIAEQIYEEFKASRGSGVQIKGADNRPIWVTKGGLVVKGDAPAKAYVAAPTDYKDNLGVKDNNDPNAPFVNVLGTIAAPARRNFAEVGGGASRGY
jgi:hypothetical protein